MCCGRNQQQLLGMAGTSTATRSGSLPARPANRMMPGARGQGTALGDTPALARVSTTTLAVRQNVPNLRRVPQQPLPPAQREAPR